MANFNYYKRKMKDFTAAEWLIAINIIMYLITYLIGFLGGNYLILLGAKINYLIAAGQYFRLITAMFLHSSFMHIVFNMMALKILGRDIERFFGPKKFLMIYFGSGILGTALSYLIISGTSVGASGAIFGLMGANLYLYWRNPLVYKRIFGSDILLLIGINLVVTFMSSNIDFAGHIGGLFGGFILAYVFKLRNEAWKLPKNILVFSTYLLLLFSIISISSVKYYNDSNFYASLSYFEYQNGNSEKAKLWLDRGLSKFPGDASLIQLENTIQ